MPAAQPQLRRLDRWLSANGRSLQITKAGWLHIALCIGVGFAAINSGSNLLHLLFGCLMGLVVISGIMSERMLARARVSMRLVDGCQARTPSAVQVEVTNVSSRAPLFAVSVEMIRDTPNTGPRLAPAFCMHVAPADQTLLTTALTMQERGWSPWPSIELVTSFPFGLFVKRRRQAPLPPVLVHPAARLTSNLRDSAADRGNGSGLTKADRSGEVVGLAEYRPGADARRVDWRAFARRQRLFVREFVDHQPHAIDLVLPRGQSGDETFEARIESLAGLAQDVLLRSEEAVSLHYDGAVLVERGNGAAHLRKILDALALVGSAKEIHEQAA